QSDVSFYLLGMCDVFVFPSLYEGLGLAVIEAQAAALPSVISDTVPREADVVPGLVYRESLSNEAQVWAERVLTVASQPQKSGDSLRIVKASEFNLQKSVEWLVRVYEARADVDA